MRVGIFVRDMPAAEGGGHTFERELLDALLAARSGTAHAFVAFGYGSAAPPTWPADDFVALRRPLSARVATRVTRVLPARLARRTSPAQSWVDALLRDRAVDLVWSLSPGLPTWSLPYVTTVWDLQHRLQPVFPEVSADGEWVAREAMFTRSLGQATRVIVGTAAGQAEVERFYGVPAERIRRLPHPTPSFALNPKDTEHDVLARYGLRPGFVIYPAQLWAHKNHVNLLYALRWLRDEQQVTLSAVFVGADKGNGEYLRRLTADLELTDQVRFLGFVPQSDLIGLYRSALALAYVSFFGPENLPPLEAMALGCPVVAADVSGAREQLADAAMLVPPTEPAAIGEALRTLYTDESLRGRLIRMGRDRAEAYTSGDFVSGMLSVLDELEPVLRTWQ